MFPHLGHLLLRSLIYTPSIISQNWWGVVLAVVIFFGKDWKRFKSEGWRTMIRRQWMRDICWAMGAYLVLFAWAVVRTVYQDHQDLVARISSLTPHSQLTASIRGSSTMDANQHRDAYIMVLVLLENGMGAERPISGWNMDVAVGSEVFPSDPFVLPGPEWKIPSATDPNSFMTLEERRFCPVVTENPLPSGATRECWYVGRFQGKHTYISQHQIVANLRFRDGLTGKTVTLTRVIEQEQ